MEAVVRTQIELLRQNSNYLTIRTRARKRFFYLGAPHVCLLSVTKWQLVRRKLGCAKGCAFAEAGRGINSAA